VSITHPPTPPNPHHPHQNGPFLRSLRPLGEDVRGKDCIKGKVEERTGRTRGRCDGSHDQRTGKGGNNLWGRRMEVWGRGVG